MRTAALVAFLALLAVPSVSAHGDTEAMEATIELGPGESVLWQRQVHWHRLMGTVDASGPVTISIEGPDREEQAIASGSSLRFDHLVACCRDATWTVHIIHLSNPGDAAVQVDADLVLLHDNLAVLAHDSEPGGWWQTLLIVGLMIAVPAWRARQPPLDGDAGAWVRRSRILHGTGWGAAVLLAAIGMVRFGGGPLVGSLGATAWLPTDGGFFNTHSYVMLLLMALWGTAVAYWAGARRRAGSPRALPWDGVAFAVGSVLVGILMAVEFGRVAIPLALGLLPAAALLADAWWSVIDRRSRP